VTVKVTNDYITTPNIVDIREYKYLSDAVTAIGSNQVTLVISEPFEVNESVTIPSNITLKFTQGGRFDIGSGYTVTINGYIEAGLDQVFGGSGNVKILKVPRIVADTTINVPGDFSTLQEALDSLRYAWIPYDVTVTINIAEGTYEHSSPIYCNHPCGDRIQIIGADPIITTITGNGTVSGSQGAWSIPIIVSSTLGIEEGQFVLVKDTEGTGDHYAFRGIWEITAVDEGSNTVTVKNTYQNSSFPTAVLTGGNLVVLKTTLKFNNLCHGIKLDTHLGFLNNVALVGASSSYYHGILLDPPGGKRLHIGSNVGITKFASGIRIESNSCVYADNGIASCGNVFHGIIVSNAGSFEGHHCTFNGNIMTGCYANCSSSFFGNYTVACGNMSSGIGAGTSASIYADYSVACGNVVNGFFGMRSAGLKLTYCKADNNTKKGFFVTEGAGMNACNSSASYNGESGFSARASGSILAENATASYNGGSGFSAQQLGSIFGNC